MYLFLLGYLRLKELFGAKRRKRKRFEAKGSQVSLLTGPRQVLRALVVALT